MKKNNKRTLTLSLLAVVLCLAMLIGSTFAWFTDNASSGINTIQSGNLDLILEYLDAEGKWQEVQKETKLFVENALWEPGYTEVVYLRVRNAGSLALKYQLTVQASAEQEGTNVAGETFKLSDYIRFGQEESDKEITAYETREAAQTAVAESAATLGNYVNSGSLEAEKIQYIALVAYMPTTVGNEANHNGTNIPSINLGVSVLATQAVSESDSFGNTYDENANLVVPWTGDIAPDEEMDNITDEDAKTLSITTAEQLAAFAAEVNAGSNTYAGYTIALENDIDLNDLAWTPINGWGGVLNGATIDGNGHTIYNMNVAGVNTAGFISNNASSLTIKDLTFSNAFIKAADGNGTYSGVVMGKNYSPVTLENVAVVNSEVRSNWQCGGLVGFAETNAPTFVNCSIEDSFVGGANCTAGAFFGLGAVDVTITGGYAKNVDLYTDMDAGLVGYLYGKTLTSTATAENVVVVSQYPA